MSHPVDWQPGDPLYRPGSYTNYLFNFRFDDEREEPGADAATWPNEVISSRVLRADRDEIADFIEDYKRWQASEEGAA